MKGVTATSPVELLRAAGYGRVYNDTHGNADGTKYVARRDRWGCEINELRVPAAVAWALPHVSEVKYVEWPVGYHWQEASSGQWVKDRGTLCIDAARMLIEARYYGGSKGGGKMSNATATEVQLQQTCNQKIIDDAYRHISIAYPSAFCWPSLAEMVRPRPPVNTAATRLLEDELNTAERNEKAAQQDADAAERAYDRACSNSSIARTKANELRAALRKLRA